MASTAITISAPITLLAEQSSPQTEGAAEGTTALDNRQRSIVIGETVPIVFGKRVTKTTYRWNAEGSTAVVYDVGGVFCSPGATEGRFQNDGTTNELAVKLHLVLSQGDMPQLQVRDVFQRACRVGTWKQTYNRRAGTWTPGNFITEVTGKELWVCPAFCGTSGYYDDLTTLSYENSHADGDATWDRQVHCFVREGIIVDRLIEGTAGSSNNVCDLAIYLIKQSSRLPDALIDTAIFTAAANFTETQQLYYNGEFSDSQNLEDWLQKISLYFLLRVSDSNGKKAFRPRLPYTDAYAIDTSAIPWVFGFTEDHVLPDGFEIEFIPYADRRPTAMQMLWRQQPDDDIGIIRTSIVRLPGTTADAPIEQHDLSEFCGSELHAAKVGAYLAARRAFVTHTLRLRVRPDAFSTTLSLGDIVRVRLRRETDPGIVNHHDYLYEVERINKSLSGAVELDLMHFPIDVNGRSVVALYVAGATINGFEYPTGRGDFTCDMNDPEDEDPIPDEGGIPGGLPDDFPDDVDVDPDLPEWPDDVPIPEFPVGPGDATPPGGVDNPTDPIDGPEPPGGGPTISGVPEDRPPLPGDEFTASGVCDGQYNEWWLCPIDGTEITQDCQLVSEGVAAPYIIGNNASGKQVFVRGRCPDPSSPTGYGAPNDSAPESLGDTPTVSCPEAPVPGTGGSFTAQQNFLTEHNAGRDWKYYIWGYVDSLPGAPGSINYTRYTNEVPWGITDIGTFFKSTPTWGFTSETNKWDDFASWPVNPPSDC